MYAGNWVPVACSLVLHLSERAVSEILKFAQGFSHATGTQLPAYTEWGVGAYREVKLPRGVRLNLRADVLNLFNKQYEIVRRYPMPGRHWKVGATVAF